MQQDFVDESITEFIESCAKQFCPWCGTPVSRNRTGRPKKFCSDKCRWAFWKFEKRHKAEKQRVEEMFCGSNETEYSDNDQAADGGFFHAEMEE